MHTKQVTNNELSRVMYRHGVRPSLMRLAVLSLVANTRKHPTADDIFTELSELYPSMSRTTVYNSLHILEDAGVIKQIDSDSGVRHYDYSLQQQHSHFVCKSCGRIIDMAMPAGVGEETLAGFEIEGVDVVYKGKCPNCRRAAELSDA